jgi:hypothetical protein
MPSNCGGPTFSSVRRRRRCASTRANLRSGPSGISARTGYRLISWYAFWLTSCGRRWSSGKAAPEWATARAPSSRNWDASRAPTWYCHWSRIRATNCAFAAWSDPIRPKHCCSRTRSQTARTSPTPAIDQRNVVPTFRKNARLCSLLPLELAKLG